MLTPGPSDFQTWFDSFEQMEVGTLFAVAAAAAAVPVRFAARVVRAFNRVMDAVAARPLLAIALPGLLSFVGATAAGLFLRYPEPEIHDEWSYLLAADTFAAGRLTNPPHPMWKHFESFHINQQPTYQSKYPPAQGLFLALGQRATGDPIVGVWFSTALAMSAFAWMFRGWLPPRWALWGSIIVFLRVGVSSYWAQGYWGGAVAALGGALVYGAYPRLRSAPTVRDSVLLALGLVVLSNSRPFEGLVVSIPIALALGWQFLKARPIPRPAWLARVAAPVLLILAADAAWIMTYNKAVTGSATTMPYFVHAKTYARISQWIFGGLNQPPPYRHETMRRYYEGEELPFYERQQHLDELLVEIPWKMVRATNIPYAGLMVLPVVFAFGVWRRRRTRLAIAGFGAALAAASTLTIFMSHYGAPAAACGFLIVMQGLRHLNALKARGRRFGRLAALGVTLVTFCMFLYLVWAHSQVGAWGHIRAHVQERIEEIQGDHLVVVRYGPRHSVHMEWVYNRADIDASRVAWARDMGDEENAELIAYFLARGRKIWLMEIDDDGVLPQPVPYPGLK
ncbi:MAG: hypothetical protein K8T20_19765 [Planctomycetes bacterium]|nr:hypothetical protein [Planctomycetota bacterium]